MGEGRRGEGGVGGRCRSRLGWIVALESAVSVFWGVCIAALGRGRVPEMGSGSGICLFSFLVFWVGGCLFLCCLCLSLLKFSGRGGRLLLFVSLLVRPLVCSFLALLVGSNFMLSLLVGHAGKKRVRRRTRAGEGAGGWRSYRV